MNLAFAVSVPILHSTRGHLPFNVPEEDLGVLHGPPTKRHGYARTVLMMQSSTFTL
jgi:hypothetical protein